AVFVIDEKAEVHSRWFGRTIIRSERKLAYEEAQQVIETGEGYYSEELKVLNKMASQLRNKRFRDGSLNFDSKEVKFDLDENGKPIGVSVKQQLDAHRLVEDFMLLANRNVAHFLGKEMNANGKLASIYRIHDEPDAEKLKDFSLFALKFGHRLNLDNPKKIASELNRLLLEIEGKPEEAILQQLAIRTMAKAVYTTENIGHYGLGFEYYTHFTSPIRRYPDVMIHRLLHRVLEKQKLIKKNDLDIICSHCSERERAALDAERSSIKYKMIEFMEDRIGEVFQGVISGIKTWGVYVELPSYNTEGMVRIDDFSDDNYVVDEKNMTIAGSHTGNKYLVGDQIYVRLTRVDKFRKTIDFSLSSEEEFLSED
ncbi:MAG TPA: RNB domain-containing ribonuclease, partial [Chitinophagales bacterium]|nr:RNB domain-containing ribonuclease [Chitinophagales bacterium]